AQERGRDNLVKFADFCTDTGHSVSSAFYDPGLTLRLPPLYADYGVPDLVVRTNSAMSSSVSAAVTLPAGFTPSQRYNAFSRFLRERFGTKVYRVTIDAGFTCPNVDGSVAVGGCVFCDNRSFSPNRRLPRSTVREQVRRGIAILQERYHADRFLA